MTDRIPLRVLLVEDDPEDVLIFRRHSAACTTYDFDVAHVSEAEAAASQLTTGRYDLVFLDLRLGEALIEPATLEHLKAAGPDVPIIVCTGVADRKVAVEMMKAGASDFLFKDAFDCQTLERCVCYALREHESAQERRRAEEALRESEERNRILLASLPQRIFFKNSDSVFVAVNEAFAQDLGLRPQDVVGKTDWDFYPKELAAKYRADDRRVMEMGKPETLVEKNVAGRAERIVEVAKAPVVNDDGETIGLFGIFTDITDRVRAREALRNAEQEKSAILGALTERVVYQDISHKILWANQAASESSGHTTEALVGRHCYEIWAGRTEPCQRCPVARAWETGQSEQAEMETPDGRVWWVRGSPMLDGSGQTVGAVETALDMTERKRAEEALQYRFELERLITTISSSFINLSHEEIDGGIDRALRAVGEFAGVDRTYVFQFSQNGIEVDNTYEWCAQGIEPQIQNLKGILLDEELPWFAKRIRDLEVLHVPRVADLPHEARLDKEHLQMQDIQSLVVVPMVAGRALVGFVGFDSVGTEKTWDEDTTVLLRIMGVVISNALERKRTEEALRASEERYRLIFENATDMISLHSLDEVTYLYVNPATLGALGHSEAELLGKTIVQFAHPEDKQRVLTKLRDAVATGGGTAEFRFRKKDGTYVWLEATSKVTPDEKGDPVILIISRDITKRVLQREELRALTLEDPLTDVNNRRGFFHLAEQQLKFANRTNSTMLLFFVDVDGMKWINDTLGHKEGDLALIEAANVLTEAFRDSDIIGRVGGDEFAILAIQAEGTKAEDILWRLQERLDGRNEQVNRRYRLSLSVGIADYDPGSPVSLDELMARADALMYEEKHTKQSAQPT